MTVSYEHSKTIYAGIRAAGIRSISALPETWLGLLLQRAEDDPEMTFTQVAREEGAIGIAAGAHFAGVPHLLLIQNQGFLAAIQRYRLVGAALQHPSVHAGCTARAPGGNRTPGTRGAGL